jgi:hypothetical protein
MSSVAALADSSQRGQSAYDKRDPDSYDYNVPLALPPYGYSPSFWGYGGRRYYDRFGNYQKYGQSLASLTRARSNRGRCAERGFKSPRACLGTAVIQLCYSAAPEHEVA